MRSLAPPAARIRIVAAAALAAVAPAAGAGAPVPQPQTRALVVRVDDGFRWGDAAIGAAAGFGAGLVLAGSLALAGRRDRLGAQEDPISRRTQ